jgi:hypothetical protein
MSDELGHPFIPFHLDIFRALRRVMEIKTRRTFGFRVHCGEIVPIPVGDVAKHPDMERVRRLHMSVVDRCIKALFATKFAEGESYMY